MTTRDRSGTIISLAPVGTRPGAEVPLAVEEVAGTALDCETIGASILDLDPRPDWVLSEVVAGVRARTRLLVRLTARPGSLPELLECGPDVLCCPLGAPAGFVAEVRAEAERLDVAVHYEARALAELDALPALAPEPAHVVLMFDGHGMPGDVHAFSAALDRLPAGTTFTAGGTGSSGVPVMLVALAAGGHVRVGMADTAEYAEGVAVRDNAQLVARAVGLAKIAQRPPMAVPAAIGVVGIGT